MPVEPRLLSSLPLPREAALAVGEFAREIEACHVAVIGAYLHGSSARGAYRHPASDVDLLVIIASSCPDDNIPTIARAQTVARASGAHVDAVFATSAQVAVNELPVPLDLVLPPDAGPQRSPGNRGMMFPLDRQDAWECGVPLCGPPVREVVPPVPRETLHASLAWVFPHLAGNFKNPELMLCRATHAFLEGRLCSKPEAGRWALQVLGMRWRRLIEKALAEREGGGSQTVCSPEELADFQRACAELVQAATGVAL
jgi:predicted nucleotidyltransferase